MEEYITIN